MGGTILKQTGLVRLGLLWLASKIELAELSDDVLKTLQLSARMVKGREDGVYNRSGQSLGPTNCQGLLLVKLLALDVGTRQVTVGGSPPFGM